MSGCSFRFVCSVYGGGCGTEAVALLGLLLQKGRMLCRKKQKQSAISHGEIR